MLMRAIFAGGCLFYAAHACNNLFKWERVSKDEVIWSWLRSEADNPKHQFASVYKKEVIKVGGINLDNPFLYDTIENDKRRQVFDKVRGKYSLWEPIQESTKWFKTKIIIFPGLNNIYSAYPPKDENGKTVHNLNGIILWGHRKRGPFIVLEGNHRWCNRSLFFPYFAEVYVGLSTKKYPLHSITGCNYCNNIEK